jgi:hypothetical protein
MTRPAYLLVAALVLGGQAAVWPQGNAPEARPKVPDGVYAVRRDSLKEKDVLPLKAGEVLVVNRYRFAPKGEEHPPRFLVVGSAPDVRLDLDGEPKAVKEGADVVRILLKLRPKAALALEGLTRDRLGRELAIIVGGDVVTTHKVRTVIKGGDVQISSCAAGAAGYLLKQLQAHREKPAK